MNANEITIHILAKELAKTEESAGQTIAALQEQVEELKALNEQLEKRLSDPLMDQVKKSGVAKAALEVVEAKKA